jgi:hypothetical protein
MDGMRRVDGYIAASQIVFALSCIVFITYRCRPSARPDAWLMGTGFVIGTLVGMPGLLDRAQDHASTWVPVRWWEVGLPLAAVLVGAGARQRAQRIEDPEPTGTGAEPNAALVGDAMLAGLVGAFVLAPPGSHALTLPLLVGTIALRHARARLIVRDNQRLTAAAVEEGERRLALYRSSFVALATAIEARDGYTGRHSEETVALAASVADRLGLSRDERSLIKTVALLHDVGKIGIPDAVLHKPGELDDAEWHVMRQHPLIGERILRTVPGLEDVAFAIRHEHERWDGGGYPDGLIGERIPLASRIVLVCDAWHAMTSDRPYRSSMAEKDALAELRRCAGTEFDPHVVEALIRAVQAP